MKIGIYGGTFDPIHRGHLTAAKAVRDALGLSELLLVVDSIPPHKALPADGAGNEDRLAMTELATAELGKWAQVSDMELRRQGKSYTSDTLRALKAMYPDDELWLIMGSDMFLSFHTWHEPEVIASLAGIAAVSRLEESEDDAFAAQKKYLEAAYGANIVTVKNPDVIEVSSTEVREALSRGAGQAYLSDAVYGYIARKHLYGTHVDLKRLTVDELRPIAMSFLKPKRMPHVLGTEQEAVRLAKQYGADVTKAQIAALLHDCTKKLNRDEQLALCAHYGIVPDPLERQTLKLLHAKTGAAVARDLFGVDDDIYNAIYWHTTGKADMTVLEKVIYMADYVEPNRVFDGVDDLRDAVHTDLDMGLLMGLQDSIEEMTERGNPVHYRTVEAKEYLENREDA